MLLGPMGHRPCFAVAVTVLSPQLRHIQVGMHAHACWDVSRHLLHCSPPCPFSPPPKLTHLCGPHCCPPCCPGCCVQGSVDITAPLMRQLVCMQER